MEKINLVELLKDCPKGMELDCTMYDNLYFDRIDTIGNIKCYIKSKDGCLTQVTFFKNGCYNTISNAKCIIYPKGKTTWAGFQRPFKDGDILTTNLGSVFILKEPNEKVFTYDCYVALNDTSRIVVSRTQFCIKKGCRLATEKEKEKLFKAIKDNGYKWDVKTKTLEEIIDTKFKVGDRIKDKYVHKDDCATEYTIRKVCTKCYITDCGSIPFENQDNYELVPNKFDITTLKPFDKILTRDGDKMCWYANIYSHYLGKDKLYQFRCMGTIAKQCIPYKGNEHLLGTTDDCDEYFKTWE